jgi:hypothetical protein
MVPNPDGNFALVHHELKRVAAVQAWASRPWYQRAWFTWPLVWQAVAILLLSAFATAVIFGAEAAGALATNVLDAVAGRLEPSLARVRVAAVAVSVVARALLEPALVYRAYTFSFIVVMGAACAALVNALQRISIERTRVS